MIRYEYCVMVTFICCLVLVKDELKRTASSFIQLALRLLIIMLYCISYKRASENSLSYSPH